MTNSYWISLSQFNSSTNSYSYIQKNENEFVDELTMYTYSYLQNYINTSNIDLFQKLSNYVSYSLNKYKVVNKSNSKKISELASRDTITKHKDHSWIPIAQYDSRTNSYHNIVMNLQTIISYIGNEIEQNNSYLLSYIENKEDTSNEVISYIDYSYLYDIIQTNVNNIFNSYSYYIDDKINDNIGYLYQRISYLISYSSKNKPSSIIRNSSKKISELASRDTITKHQDHSWIPMAQYDSRTNSYHNITINLKTITSYSIDEIDKKYNEIFKLLNLTSYLSEYDLAYYINNSIIAKNLITYAITYNQNYLDWQFL